DLSGSLAFKNDGAETGFAESFGYLEAVAAGFEDEHVAGADVFACPLDESCDGKRVPEAFDFGGGGIAADEGGGAVDVRMHVPVASKKDDTVEGSRAVTLTGFRLV